MDIFHAKQWGVRNYISLIWMVVWMACMIWVTWGAYSYVNKIDSPQQMIEFRQYIEAMKKVERNVNENNTNDPESNGMSGTGETLDTQFCNVKLEDLEHYILSPLDIAIDNKSPIACGMFGAVHKGLLVKNGAEFDIAIKSSKTTESSATFSMILQELKILIHVGNHSNIVKFFGILSHTDLNADDFGIVNEFCSYGSLSNFLTNHKCCFKFNAQEIKMSNISASGTYAVTPDCKTAGTKRCALNLIDLYRFAFQICSGMEHLASKKVIHGDLAARNVLLTENLTIKITDFGMSRRLYNYQLYSQLENSETLLPWKWMSIEALEDLKFSEKSDVWAFGVTVWELFTLGKSPYKGMTWDSGFTQLLRTGFRLPVPTFGNSDLFDAMETCWQLLCEDRPSFSKLKSTLESTFQKIKLEERYTSK